MGYPEKTLAHELRGAGMMRLDPSRVSVTTIDGRHIVCVFIGGETVSETGEDLRSAIYGLANKLNKIGSEIQDLFGNK